MNSIASILPAVRDLAVDTDWLSVLKAVVVFCAALFLLGAAFRAIFGKGSSLTRSVSASISILMVYLTAIALFYFVPSLRDIANQLPFLSVTQERFMLWDIARLSQDTLCSALLRMALLAFLVNILEDFLPEGSGIVSWYLWRCVTVLASLGLYTGICSAADTLAPQIFGSWAMYILIAVWAVILLSGVLKLVLSVALTVVNPIVGVLYTFFFSNKVGKQFSKAILTTLIMVAVFFGLNELGLTQFSFSQFSLAAYGPTCLIAAVVLYLFGKLL